MRSTKAKNLRKQHGTDVAYETIAHKPKLVRVGINTDGSPQLAKMVPITLVLADCGRKRYQEAKKAL